MSRLFIFVPVTIITLVLLFFGALALNAPLRLGGPMIVGIAPAFLGSLAMVLAIRLSQALASVRPGVGRWIYACGFIAMLLAGGWNFYSFPPIQDGAYQLLRYGRGEIPWPAGPAPTVVLVSGIIVLLQGALFGRLGTVSEPARRYESAIEVGIFMVLAFVLYAAYISVLNKLIGNGVSWWLLYPIGMAAVIFIAGFAPLRRFPVAVWAILFSGAFIVLVTATATLFGTAVYAPSEGVATSHPGPLFHQG